MGSAELYNRARARMLGLSADISDDEPVPATPGWCFRDLLAHVVGVAVDLADGNVAAWAAPEWTARQVDDRSGRASSSLFEPYLAVWLGPVFKWTDDAAS